MRIGLFIPCYIDAFFPEVGIATLALLDARDCAPRGVRARRHPDAAGDPRCGVHAVAGTALHSAAHGRDAVAASHRHERALLSRRRTNAERQVPLLRFPARDQAATGAADACVPFSIMYLMGLFVALLADHYLPRVSA